MELSVQKRDGKTEPWSMDKLIAAIGRAGVPVEEASNLAKTIEEWAKSAAVKGVIASSAIRDKVIVALKAQFPVESDNYQAYKKE